jgi:hypothetical protein
VNPYADIPNLYTAPTIRNTSANTIRILAAWKSNNFRAFVFFVCKKMPRLGEIFWGLSLLILSISRFRLLCLQKTAPFRRKFLGPVPLYSWVMTEPYLISLLFCCIICNLSSLLFLLFNFFLYRLKFLLRF